MDPIEASIRPGARRRATRMQTLWVGVPFVLFGIFVGGIGAAQEMPRGVTDDLLQSALDGELDAPTAATAESPQVEPELEVPPRTSFIPALVWLLGLGAATLTIPRVRSGALGIRHRMVRRGTRGHGSSGSGHASDGDAARAVGANGPVRHSAEGSSAADSDDTIVDISEYRRSRERAARAKASEPTPALKLPPHVVAMLAKNRARGVADSPEPGPGDAPNDSSTDTSRDPAANGGLDIMVPRYDPRRNR